MSTIYDPLPLEVQDNLAKLKADLDDKIPSKELDKNLLIASWNIRAFGNLTREWMSKESDSPRRDLHSIFCIAEILLTSGMSHPKYFFRSNKGLMARCSSVRKRVLVSFC